MNKIKKPSKLYIKLLDAYEEIAKLENNNKTLNLVKKYKKELKNKGGL